MLLSPQGALIGLLLFSSCHIHTCISPFMPWFCPSTVLYFATCNCCLHVIDCTEFCCVSFCVIYERSRGIASQCCMLALCASLVLAVSTSACTSHICTSTQQNKCRDETCVLLWEVHSVCHQLFKLQRFHLFLQFNLARPL